MWFRGFWGSRGLGFRSVEGFEVLGLGVSGKASGSGVDLEGFGLDSKGLQRFRGAVEKGDEFSVQWA